MMKFLDLIQPTEAEQEWLAQEFLQQAAALYDRNGLWRKAAECREDAGQIAQAADLYLAHDDHARAAPLLLKAGRHGQALECYRQWRQSLPEHDILGQLRSRLGIAACLRLIAGDSPAARETFRSARSLIENADAERPALIAGQCWEALGAYGALFDRLDLIQVGYEMAMRCYGEEHPKDWLRAAQEYLYTVNPEQEKGKRREPKTERQKELWVEPVTGMEFVWIPEGRFLMGSPETEEGRYDNESPQHEVSINGFWLAKTPVTNAQYRLWKTDHDSQEYQGHSLNGDEQPVVYVSWEDAKAFMTWLNEQHGGTFEFRLPSEAEWEYACRAGTTTARFWGDDPHQAGDYANVSDLTKKEALWFSGSHHCETGFVVTSPVGSFQPNAFGLYDMLGNVLEWCEDPWHGNYTDAPSDGGVWEERGGPLRVLRGGSWFHFPGDVRCAFRSHYSPQSRHYSIGFRLARTF